MYRYAQITPNGMCISVLQLAEEVEDARLIPLSESDNVNPRDTWDGKKWTPAPPFPEPEPQPTQEQERIEQLESENALIALELIDTQIRLEQAEQEQAALLLELVSRGVI